MDTLRAGAQEHGLPEHGTHFVTDTVVVGAGVAGLTVARALHLAGQRVIVLEARDRIGGRVYSQRDERDGTWHVTDVGASWIHGIDDGPVHEVASAFGMPMVEFSVGSFQVDGRPIAYYGPDGERLTDDVARAFATDVHDFDTALSEVVAASAPGTSYDTAVETTLTSLGWGADRAARVREFMHHRTEEQYGVWAGDLDAHGLDDDATNGDEVVFPEGFDQLATHLAEGLDVRLGHVVQHVHWSESRGVRVESNRGVVLADRVVVTVPVGVLKSGELRIDPPLPASHGEALDRLEMNAFEKIVLRFDRAFWDEGVYAVRRQGEAGAWWHSWYDVTRVHGTPSLLTFAAGPCARAIRSWSDAEVANSVMTSLREIYTEAPDPVHVVVTRWQDDPFSRGSYAYMTVGSHTDDHDLLATPLGGTLFVAGEATWTDDPATVTAAMSSGLRAAGQILGREVSAQELYGDIPQGA